MMSRHVRDWAAAPALYTGKVKDGVLHPQKRPRGPGKQPERVFSPDEIAALMPHAPMTVTRRELNPSDFPSDFPPTAEVTEMPDVTWENLLPVIQTVVESLQQPAPKEALWITIEDAAAESGLSEAFLTEARRVGAIDAVYDQRSYKVRRADLERIDIGKVAEARKAVRAKRK